MLALNMNKLHLLAGLPRTGITVLGAILNQNPEMYVSTTSSFVEVLWRNYSVWHDENAKADLDTVAIKRMKYQYLRNVGNIWFENLTDKSVVIDKRRAWHNISNIKMYKEIYGIKPKIICTVRDIAEIIVSFMKVFENNDKVFVHHKSLNGDIYAATYNELRDTFYDSYFADCIHIVEYNDICNNTEEVLNNIYRFLEMKPFKHDLKNIVVHEKEGNHHFKNLHKIKGTLTKTNTNLLNYLTPHEIEKYNADIFWRTNG